ncbi:hypothetical protein BC830DRAFT_543750 [Chytriomyces sp. MP71]|nr:hypothetical protein BC830DRAFT_543750 [Chytriomyces sp. MP71]
MNATFTLQPTGDSGSDALRHEPEQSSAYCASHYYQTSKVLPSPACSIVPPTTLSLNLISHAIQRPATNKDDRPSIRSMCASTTTSSSLASETLRLKPVAGKSKASPRRRNTIASLPERRVTSATEKRSLREQQRNLVCANCGSIKTPLWRKCGEEMCCNACGLFFKHRGHHRPLKSQKCMFEKAPQVTVEADQPGLSEGFPSAANNTNDFARTVTQSFGQTFMLRQLSLLGTKSEMYIHSPRAQSPVSLASAAASVHDGVTIPPHAVPSVYSPSLDDATMAFFLSTSLPVSAAASPFLSAQAVPLAPLNHQNTIENMTADSIEPMSSFQELLWGVHTSPF